MSKTWIAAAIGISIAVLLIVAVTSQISNVPAAAVETEPAPCQKVGDVCALRFPRKAALAYSAQKYYIQDNKDNKPGDHPEISLINGKAILILQGSRSGYSRSPTTEPRPSWYGTCGISSPTA
jgi:hypothetical protein